MEDPSTWAEAEKAVHEEYVRWWEDRQNLVCGLSLARRVTDRLRREGLLVESEVDSTDSV